MKTATVAWTLPTSREAGAALDPSEIREVLVELSADGGANFGEIDRVIPTDPQQANVPDLEAGDWSFRLTVIDTNGVTDLNPHVEAFTVPDDSAPGSVTGVTITLT